MWENSTRSLWWTKNPQVNYLRNKNFTAAWTNKQLTPFSLFLHKSYEITCLVAAVTTRFFLHNQGTVWPALNRIQSVNKFTTRSPMIHPRVTYGYLQYNPSLVNLNNLDIKVEMEWQAFISSCHCGVNDCSHCAFSEWRTWSLLSEISCLLYW